MMCQLQNNFSKNPPIFFLLSSSNFQHFILQFKLQVQNFKSQIATFRIF